MIAVLDADAETRDRMIDCLAAGTVVAELDDPDRAGDLLTSGDLPTDVLVVGPSQEPRVAAKLAARLVATTEAPAVVMVARRVTRALLRDAMRAGVADVLAWSSIDEELGEAVASGTAATITRREQFAHEPPAPPRRRRVTVVFSMKGGSGRSFIAANLAVGLRAAGADVALVDLDLASGDLAIMLQLLPAWTIHDATEHVERLDVDALQAYLTPHRSGVQLLAAPPEPALAEDVRPEGVDVVLDLIRGRFDHVIVDCPAAFSDVTLTALDHADEVVLVGSLDVPSVKNLKLGLHTLERLGIHRDRIHIVLNRAGSSVGLRLGEVEKVIGTTIDVPIPSGREVPLSINEGTPLLSMRRRSTVGKALRALVSRVHDSATG